MFNQDSGHSSDCLSTLPVVNNEDCLIPFIADTAEKIHQIFEDIRAEMTNIEAIYGRVPDAVQNYVVGLDEENRATVENAKAMNAQELQQLLYLEIVKNRRKDREIGRLQSVEERLALVETLFQRQSNCLANLETELNNALLALSERELSRIEAIRDMEYKFQEQAQILSGFRKGDLSALKAAKITAPEMSATTPESELRRTIETLKKSMKQREKQAELKLLQLEDEIQRREAKIKQLEFILKTERDMNLKELNQRRSMVPNLEQIIKEEKRNLECEYRAEMVQYKSEVDSEARRFHAELEEVLRKERETSARLRNDRNKYAQLYGEAKGHLAVIERNSKISHEGIPKIPLSTNTSTTNITESTEMIHLGLPKHQHSIKESGTPTKGLDNCQLCDTPFDQDANKENTLRVKNFGALTREALKVFEHEIKLSDGLKEKEKCQPKKMPLYETKNQAQPTTSSSKFFNFRRRSKSFQQKTQTEQDAKSRNEEKHVKMLRFQPLPMTGDRYSPAHVKSESKIAETNKQVLKKQST